jgi:DNA repair protein RadC
MVAPESAAGHRARLRERFAQNGLAALHDYEVLELLLTYVLPRRDTKPPAKELLRRFRTVNGVLNAGPEALRGIAGLGSQAATFFALLREFTAWCLRERVERRSAITHRSNVEEYLRFAFGGRPDEYVAVLFLDAGNKVISAEVLSEGTVNQCVLYPRTVVEKAVACGAASLILAHNHPAGSLTPSEADWALTARLFEVGKLLDLPLVDHLIVCQDHVQSLRALPRWPA